MPKNYASLLSFLLLCGLVYFTFFTFKPQFVSYGEIPEDEFSIDRALQHLKVISEKPHSVGTPAHQEVQDYIVKVLQDMGLETQTQEAFAYKPGWGALSKAQNIMARIKGTGDGKALLVFSHYDSAPHTASYGASDAGSGVVTVLESIRAFLATGKKPKNDIIILFTDAEELGLNGASVFAKEHPWAKDVGVALNFEARGSGGPSNMIVETNGGNSKLIKAFAKANPENPYANSLAYSIYKILPNDTDSTVMREFADIDGFFFAFLSDHFDYHTAMDTYDRLDRSSLQQQGQYLMPLLAYFADADLDLKSDVDYVYLNVPIIKMMYYPFSWIWPMLILAVAGFIILVLYGISIRKLSVKSIFFGFAPLLLSLIASAGLTYLGYVLIMLAYPEFADILQGFPYNGYHYLTAFVALSLSITFFIYYKFHRPVQAADLSIAPIFLWLVIATLCAIYLPGASFFVVPVYFALFAVFLLLKFDKLNLFWLCLLCAPAIFIVSGFIQQFPLGLGLKMVPASALFTVLLFGLLLPVIGHFSVLKVRISLFFLLISVIAFVSAHFNSSFSSEQPFPTSLNYVYDVDTKKAVWATYNKYPDAWIKYVLGDDMQEASNLIQAAGAGKYNTNFTFAAEAPRKPVAQSSIYVSTNFVEDGVRHVHFLVYPQREVNDMILLSPTGTPFQELSFNGQEVELQAGQPFLFNDRKSDYLLSYRVADREPLDVELELPENAPLKFTLYDLSYDLLQNDLFNVPSRPENSMPMPFVNTDAIVTKQTITLYNPEKAVSNE
ncbi:M20/M25/M40 family metallo-hydrolase [Flavimarina sp. Hel_I_48]|uniref:M20/M25/M40 family metallo-hydrolase n=1 Tax=Flavimarina sp. Hel_I_48 TaxID=1392488 RepID=UPI0004DED6BF|nr:M20/M25/M40 family metallo-hydrolase [Flavimarina sp. Hel_I_48]